MITPILPQIENTLKSELPDELYDMMSSMKFTVDRQLEPIIVRKFNIPVLTKISSNTTPVDYITRTILSIVNF